MHLNEEFENETDKNLSQQHNDDGNLPSVDDEDALNEIFKSAQLEFQFPSGNAVSLTPEDAEILLNLLLYQFGLPLELYETIESEILKNENTNEAG